MLPKRLSLCCSGASAAGEESIETLLTGAGFRLERIDSFGRESPQGFWYDQEEPEWVLLMRGEAALEFAEGVLELSAGDYLLIPAHVRHRVRSTSPDSVWLALHFREKAPTVG